MEQLVSEGLDAPLAQPFDGGQGLPRLGELPGDLVDQALGKEQAGIQVHPRGGGGAPPFQMVDDGGIERRRPRAFPPRKRGPAVPRGRLAPPDRVETNASCF